MDGCFDHREMIADEELHRHAAENIGQADALLFGRVTYEMMEAATRRQTQSLHRFTLRTKLKVDVQWRLFALIHNIGKIHTFGAIH